MIFKNVFHDYLKHCLKETKTWLNITFPNVSKWWWWQNEASFSWHFLVASIFSKEPTFLTCLGTSGHLKYVKKRWDDIKNSISIRAAKINIKRNFFQIKWVFSKWFLELILAKFFEFAKKPHKYKKNCIDINFSSSKTKLKPTCQEKYYH